VAGVFLFVLLVDELPIAVLVGVESVELGVEHSVRKPLVSPSGVPWGMLSSATSFTSISTPSKLISARAEEAAECFNQGCFAATAAVGRACGSIESIEKTWLIKPSRS